MDPSSETQSAIVISTFSNANENMARKLPEFPQEIWLDILDQLHPVLTDFDIIEDGYSIVLSKDYRRRVQSLQALAETCQTWRAVLFPLVWHRLEAFFSVGPSLKPTRLLGYKLDALIDGAVYQPYVQIVTVSIEELSTTKLIGTFAQCLTLLPNLHTIEVIKATRTSRWQSKEAFDGITLPTVRRLVLCCNATAIVKSCTEIEDLVCTDYCSTHSKYLLRAIVLDGRPRLKLKNLRGIFFPRRMLRHLRKCVPFVRSIEFSLWGYGGLVEPQGRMAGLDVRYTRNAYDFLGSNSYPGETVRCKRVSHRTENRLEVVLAKSEEPLPSGLVTEAA